MIRLVSYTLVVLIAAVAAVTAQKVTSANELDQNMKRMAPAQRALNKAIESKSWADAKAQLATVRRTLMDGENFWTVNKKADAVKMLRETLARLGAVEKALSAPAPDQPAVLAAFKQMGAACTACHMKYREQDENQEYRLKPGSI